MAGRDFRPVETECEPLAELGQGRESFCDSPSMGLQGGWMGVESSVISTMIERIVLPVSSLEQIPKS